MMEGTDPGNPNWRRQGVSYRVELASDEFAREPYARDLAARAGGQAIFASDRQIAGLRSVSRRIVDSRIASSYVDVSEQLISLSDNGVSLRYSNTGASPTALFNSLHIHSWALSPDGLRLAFASAEDSTQTDSLNSRVMRIMPVEGGEAVEVFRVAQKSEIIVTRWAPDGAALLLYVENPEDEDEDGVIWRVPLDGGRPIRTDLSLTERQLALLDFHPDGSHIAFGTTEAWTEIWAMDGFPWTKDR
jgi:dipeptidyl aminopeptidase/acylaminoacyl peptidase